MAVVPEQVIKTVANSGEMDPQRACVVMLSGGRDSVCLLDIVHAVLESGQLIALHVNYGLRPEADADAEFCRDLCARYNVELQVEHAGALPPTGNLQNWARDLRYAAAQRLATAHDAAIAVGHTASDQVETVLYRLASSPGRQALMGMPQRRGRIIRPLLSLTRTETANYCRARGLSWREDQSNQSDQFARGRIRNAILPQLRQVHPAAERNILNTVELLRAEQQVLDQVVTDAIGARDRIAIAELEQLPAALQRLVVLRLAEQAGSRAAATVSRRRAELLQLGKTGGTRALDLGEGLTATVEYGQLHFTTAPQVGALVNQPSLPPVELAVPGRVTFGDFEIVAAECAPTARLDVVDLEKLPALVSVRTWRAGDRIDPVGMRGRKKLQDIFVDRKVPRGQRGLLPVVTTQAAIVCVPGHVTARRFAVTADTRHGLQFSTAAGLVK